MNDKLATIPAAAIDQAALESVIGYGDLTKLNSQQRTAYYAKVCESLGLNPLTRPFEFINLNGKLVFYARRDCTDQLRKIHSVSITIVSRERLDDVYVVTARASFPDGRVDESIGAVPVGNAKGETLANALMKAETKAKRRVTLAICGLSVLDETELDGAREMERKPQFAQSPECGFGTQPEPPQLGPHSPHDDGADYSDADMGEYERLVLKMAHAEDLADKCSSYENVLELEEYLGSRAKQSELTRAIQAAKEARSITPEQHKILSAKWQHLYRELTKEKPPGLKARFPAPDATASFVDAEPNPEDDGR